MTPVYKSVEEAYRAELQREVEIVTNAILNGGMTKEKYDWHTGQLSGFRIALRIFDELMEKFHNQ